MNLLAKLVAKGIDSKASKMATDLDYSEFQLSGDEKIVIRFFGTASFSIESKGHTLVFDPYVTRPSAKQHLEPLSPNKKLVQETFPRANDVFVGHAHSDHILDAPFLCEQNKCVGARLIGSESVRRTGKAFGLSEEQMHRVSQDREEIESGPAKVTAIESRHGVFRNGAVIRGINGFVRTIRTPDPNRRPKERAVGLKGEVRGVLFPGETSEDLKWPPYAWELKCGQVYDWLVEIEGTKIIHIDSARAKDRQFEGMKADIVCLCAANREPGFVKKVMTELEPSVVIPCHWDSFFGKPDSNGAMPELGPAKIKKLLAELEEYDANVHLLRYGGTFGQ